DVGGEVTVALVPGALQLHGRAGLRRQGALGAQVGEGFFDTLDDLLFHTSLTAASSGVGIVREMPGGCLPPTGFRAGRSGPPPDAVASCGRGGGYPWQRAVSAGAGAGCPGSVPAIATGSDNVPRGAPS